MVDISKLLDGYEENIQALLSEPYGSDTFKKAEENVIEVLKEVRGHISDKDLERLTKVLDEYGGQEILVELAYTLGDIGTSKSFDYLLLMFNQSFSDGCEEYGTAMACLEEMSVIDKERAKREGVYDHPMLLE